MTKKEIIQLSLQAAIVILGIIYLVTIFSKKPTLHDNSGEIKAKDETIQAVIRERDTYREWKDEAISELRRKDSALQVRYKTNTVIYEKIPVTVANYSDNELRRAVEDFR